MENIPSAGYSTSPLPVFGLRCLQEKRTFPTTYATHTKEGPATMTQEINQQLLGGERALFHAHDLRIVDTVFTDGESPLKESSDIELVGSAFRWKYPLWYATHVTARKCTWFEMARSGVWYTDDILVEDSVIEAPKNFRRCTGVTLRNVALPNAAETLWTCRNVTLENVTAKGDYFAMNSEDIEVDGLVLDGNYSFDGARHIHVKNSRLLSKDSFWNTEDVLVEDSYIAGEYLGWNSRNLRLVNCTIESLQGMCYAENIVLENCKLINTTLAFEYSSVTANLTGRVESMFNPESGTIEADQISELILDDRCVDPAKTSIACRVGEVPAPVSPESAGAQGPCSVEAVLGD